MDGDHASDSKEESNTASKMPAKIVATATGIFSTIGTELTNAINRFVTVKPPINLPQRSYAVGDCVFRSKPYLWVAGNKHISNYCNMCAVRLPENSELSPADDASGCPTNIPIDPIPSTSDNIFDFQVCRCPTCNLATYCNPRCRQEAWTVGMHRKECILYQRWIAAARREEDAERRKNADSSDSATNANGVEPSATLDGGEADKKTSEKIQEAKEKPLHGCIPKKLTRIIALAILKLAEGVDRNAPGQCIPECNVSFWDLMSHWAGEREKRQSSVDSVEWIREQLDHVIPTEWTRERSFLEFDKLGNVYGRIITNIFYIREYRVRLLQFGTALYLNPAKIDHSCTPSASYVQSCGNVLEIYTVEPQQAFKDLRLSYVTDLLRPRQWRASQLTSLWLFECQCDGCENNERERVLVGLLCTQNNCTGAVCADIEACKRRTELELSTKEAVKAPYPAQTEDAGGVVDAVAEKDADKPESSAKVTDTTTAKILSEDDVVKSDDAEADNGDDVNDTSKDVENPETETLPPMLPSILAKDYGCTKCGFHAFPQEYIDEALAVLDGTVKYVDDANRTLEVGLPLLERALKCLHPTNAMVVKFMLLLLDTNWNEMPKSEIDREMVLVARVLPKLLLTMVQTLSYLPRELSFQFTVILRALRYVKYLVEFKGTVEPKSSDAGEKSHATEKTTPSGVELLLRNFDESKTNAWNVSKTEFLHYANELMQVLRDSVTMHFSNAMRDHERMVLYGHVGYGEEKCAPVDSTNGGAEGDKNQPNLSPSVPWCSAVRKRGIYAEESLTYELDDELTPMVASLGELFEHK